MANSLLDFVMSLVRDPDAAAAYADDPEQAIADANLTDVTSVDVNNLIPVVSESLSMAVPSTGADGIVDIRQAMFGQVAPQRPRSMRSTTKCRPSRLTTCTRWRRPCRPPDAGVHTGLDTLADAGVPDVAAADDPSLQFDGPVIDDCRSSTCRPTDDWSDAVLEDRHIDADTSGFDIFDL